jgi:hypothetical protein
LPGGKEVLAKLVRSYLTRVSKLALETRLAEEGGKN